MAMTIILLLTTFLISECLVSHHSTVYSTDLNEQSYSHIKLVTNFAVVIPQQ